MSTKLTEIVDYFKDLQNDICKSLEVLDGKKNFREDLWDRPEGGGGRSRIIENGDVFEKGGVNFSHVHGKLPEVLKSAERNAEHFDATGVSIVIHPNNPFVPIIHMNVRYFQMDNGEYWFGGGIDLSPAYVIEEDAQFFHERLKAACDKNDESFYPKFKKWCDEYFYIKHRNEMRGVGGIFFDHLKSANSERGRSEYGRSEYGRSEHNPWKFVQSVAESFVPIYAELVNRNKDKSFTETNRDWQLYRRGRYVEFNLVYDRGTHFGLKTNGRIESILMSLPPQANWVYDHKPEQGSAEEKTVELLQGRDWVR